jgi:hypothetical protein
MASDLLHAFLSSGSPQHGLPAAFHLALLQGWLTARAEGKPYKAEAPDLFLRDVVLSRAGKKDAALFLSQPLLDYLNAPAPLASALPLTRFMAVIFESLGEVKKNFDLSKPEGVLRFYQAYAGDLARTYHLPRELLPPAATEGGALCTLLREKDFAPTAFSKTADATLVGPADVENGLGSGVRYMADGLAEAGVNFSILNRYAASGSRSGDARYRKYETPQSGAPINIIHYNSDMLAENMLAGGIGNFTGRTNIGYFVWETSKLGTAHKLGLSLVDEIWVPTEFMRELYARETSKPVLCMGSVVQPPAPKGARRDFGLSDDFMFLFTYDSASRQTRKNPLGVTRAFRQAFSGNEKVQLVLKTQNAAKLGGMEKELYTELQKAAAEDKHIRIIDETFEAEKLAGLIASADAYVSLHRCEGFGYGMAEAMYFGVPVIATNWSGNVDFIKEDTAWQVPFKLVPVKPGEYHYAEEGGHEWAEPDLAAASRAMRDVFDNRDAAKARAQAGQKWIREQYSASVVGERMSARLAHSSRD